MKIKSMKITNSMNESRRINFDRNGNIESETDFANIRHYDYDENGRIRYCKIYNAAYILVEQIAYAYNDEGKLSHTFSILKSADEPYLESYQYSHRSVTVSYASGEKVYKEFDKNNNLLFESISHIKNGTKSISYHEYDDNNMRISSSIFSDSGTEFLHYEYNDHKDISRIIIRKIDPNEIVDVNTIGTILRCRDPEYAPINIYLKHEYNEYGDETYRTTKLGIEEWIDYEYYED